MKAVDEDLGNILQRERRLLVPTYQRDYEWTEEGQWELLADDLLDVADRLFEARVTAKNRGEDLRAAEKRVSSHFLGAVVVEPQPAQGAAVSVGAVIDGQQRMTTVFLLFRALVDLLSEEGLDLHAKRARKLILIPRDDVREDEEQYKLWPRRRDRDEWVKVMDETAPEGAHPYTKCRRYFLKRMNSALDERDSQDRKDWAEALHDALVSKVRLVHVDLESLDDAQLIFEVLNGRQTPLSAADLVKNLIFMGARADEDDLQRLYDKYWEPFDDAWWSARVGRGHAARGRRDQLLATWLTIQTSDDVNLGRLYGESRAFLASSDMPVESLLQGIADLAREYRNIYERSDGVLPENAAVYERLERLGITTAVPLFAWLRIQRESRLTLAGHRRAVAAVDSFVMRRLMTGQQTRGYGRAFVEVLQAAQSAPESSQIDDVIVATLRDAPYGYQWPSDEDVAYEFVNRPYYDRLAQFRIRAILGPIDREMQRESKFTEKATFEYEELTIEHIMPQTWKKHLSLIHI